MGAGRSAGGDHGAGGAHRIAVGRGRVRKDVPLRAGEVSAEATRLPAVDRGGRPQGDLPAAREKGGELPSPASPDAGAAVAGPAYGAGRAPDRDLSRRPAACSQRSAVVGPKRATETS